MSGSSVRCQLEHNTVFIPSTNLGACADCPNAKLHEHAPTWLDELVLSSVRPSTLRYELWEENRGGLLFCKAPLVISVSISDNMKILTMKLSQWYVVAWREVPFWQNGIRLVTGGGTSIRNLKLESAPTLQSCEPFKRVGRTTGREGLGPKPREHQLFPLPWELYVQGVGLTG